MGNLLCGRHPSRHTGESSSLELPFAPNAPPARPAPSWLPDKFKLAEIQDHRTRPASWIDEALMLGAPRQTKSLKKAETGHSHTALSRTWQPPHHSAFGRLRLEDPGHKAYEEPIQAATAARAEAELRYPSKPTKKPRREVSKLGGALLSESLALAYEAANTSLQAG